MRFLLALALLPVLANSGAALEPCVKIRITNCVGRSVGIAYGPVTLCAESRVTPDANHRVLLIDWAYAEPDQIRADLPAVDDDTPEMLREPDKQDGPLGSSMALLDGAQERIRHDRKLHGLSGGTYTVTASVYADYDRKKLCGRAATMVTIR